MSYLSQVLLDLRRRHLPDCDHVLPLPSLAKKDPARLGLAQLCLSLLHDRSVLILLELDFFTVFNFSGVIGLAAVKYLVFSLLYLLSARKLR